METYKHVILWGGLAIGGVMLYKKYRKDMDARIIDAVVGPNQSSFTGDDFSNATGSVRGNLDTRVVTATQMGVKKTDRGGPMEKPPIWIEIIDFFRGKR